MSDSRMTEPAKLLLLASILAKGRVISSNGKAFLKELILRRDPRLLSILASFDSNMDCKDSKFLDTLNSVIEDEAERLYDTLFDGCSLEHGKCVSKAERQDKGLVGSKSLIYGEVEFQSFAKVLRKIGAPAGQVFYDLGSGTGKAVFVARFLHDFGKCGGIEVLQGLHGAALEVKRRYESGPYADNLTVGNDDDIDLREGSILEEDWSDGDVVFANSTCFDDNLMEAMARQASKLKPGAFFVTFTKGLNSPSFEVMERKRYKMSWGPATVYIQRRLNHDGTAASTETLRDVPDDDSDKDDDADDDDSSDEDSEEEEEEDDDEDSDDDEDALEDLD
mmetsp:Transcript_22134/g.43586  ORF Transcript_22134/g.43586 Transcript_22134/m.43586 type:complete len:335 (+) Transcript_22134:86-1090(+)